MRVDVTWYKVTEEDANQPTMPVLFVRRDQVGDDPSPKPFSVAKPGSAGKWWVPKGSVFDDNCEWSMTTKGDVVQVPLVAYRTTIASRSQLFGLGIEIGTKASLMFQMRARQPPSVLKLILGTTAPEYQNAYRAFVGIAFVVE